MTVDQIRSLQPKLAALLETFRPYLGFASNVGHLLAYVCGLLGGVALLDTPCTQTPDCVCHCSASSGFACSPEARS